jgi:hypothetical protein
MTLSDPIAVPIRVDHLRNPWTMIESAVDVTVIATDLHDFVIIEDIGEGPSITNAAESICPQVAERLLLVWARCVFIEKYPASAAVERLDPTYDRILFSGPPVGWRAQGHAEPIPVAPVKRWMPLDLPLARSLQSAGVLMSQHIGAIGRFQSFTDGHEFDALIANYDGRRYYSADGHQIDGRLLRPVRNADEIPVDA